MSFFGFDSIFFWGQNNQTMMDFVVLIYLLTEYSEIMLTEDGTPLEI